MESATFSSPKSINAAKTAKYQTTFRNIFTLKRDSQQMQGIFCKDLLLFGIGDIHCLYCIDGLPITSKTEIVITQRHIGSIHYVVSSPEMIGQNEQRVFMITKGKAAIGRKTEEGIVPLIELSKGDFFGHIPFLKMGHEPHAASVFASADLKISPLDVSDLVTEYEGLPNSFRHIIENLASCISVTTMIACENHKNLHLAKTSKAP